MELQDQKVHAFVSYYCLVKVFLIKKLSYHELLNGDSTFSKARVVPHALDTFAAVLQYEHTRGQDNFGSSMSSVWHSSQASSLGARALAVPT